MFYREDSFVYEVLVRNPGGKTILRGNRRKFEDNSMIDLRELECGVVEWTYLALDMHLWRALVNAIMNFHIPLNVGIS